MKLLRKILYILIFLFTLGVGVFFAQQNKMPVPLDLLVYTFEPKSLALWVLGAFALGGICGLLMSSALMVRQRATIGATNRQLAKARTEVDKLRTAGLTDGE